MSQNMNMFRSCGIDSNMKRGMWGSDSPSLLVLVHENIYDRTRKASTGETNYFVIFGYMATFVDLI